MSTRLPGRMRQGRSSHRDGLWHWEDPSDPGVGVECVRKGACGRRFNSVQLDPYLVIVFCLYVIWFMLIRLFFAIPGDVSQLQVGVADDYVLC